MLAGMINAPEQDDPFHDLDAARRRAATVLDAMVANGKLTEEAALAAKLHPATPAPAEISPPSTGWFVDWVYKKAGRRNPPLEAPFACGRRSTCVCRIGGKHREIDVGQIR